MVILNILQSHKRPSPTQLAIQPLWGVAGGEERARTLAHEPEVNDHINGLKNSHNKTFSPT